MVLRQWCRPRTAPSLPRSRPSLAVEAISDEGKDDEPAHQSRAALPISTWATGGGLSGATAPRRCALSGRHHPHPKRGCAGREFTSSWHCNTRINRDAIKATGHSSNLHPPSLPISFTPLLLYSFHHLWTQTGPQAGDTMKVLPLRPFHRLATFSCRHWDKKEEV
jgi:hypothetical protein